MKTVDRGVLTRWILPYLALFGIGLSSLAHAQEALPECFPKCWQLPTEVPATEDEEVIPPSWMNFEDPIPFMAHYYIWFENQRSWERAKKDYPLLGRYSSDDRTVMEYHVRQAKEAGIDGFIVSWKSSFNLDRRLEQLMEVAAEEEFYLWIIYQGLDFDRNPLPLDRIDADLEFFIERYADHPVFKMYERPVVVWSGTWEFETREIEEITSAYRNRLMFLATERNVDGYLRLAEYVDGNLYYWSSVNPNTFPAYQQKLDEMSRTVHRYRDLWVAPAAPGFDARMLGGKTVVERDNGETFRAQLNAALKSAPDVVGIISWNEFSENTHIEPSESHGDMALSILAGREITPVPKLLDFDSNAPATTEPGSVQHLSILGGMVVFIIISITAAVLRRRERQRTLF